MMRRPRLFDLYCNAGGAAKGYQRAGFDVVGQDLHRQPRYPGQFRQGDVLALDPRWIAENFDAVHASPPCQGYTDMVAPGQRGAPRLIRPTVALLEATGLPWVLENVEGAADEMPGAITLCGSMFNLGTAQPSAWLKRHRLFMSNVPLAPPSPCRHPENLPCIGVYGGHARIRAARHGGRRSTFPWPSGPKAAMQEAMGIDWATTAEMSEALPPAYTEWLGLQLLAYVLARQVAA